MSKEPELLTPLPYPRVQHLTEAMLKFNKDMDDNTRHYLAGRGLNDAPEKFGLGVVRNPDPEWEQYNNHLSIPYINANNECVGIRFRNLSEGGQPKYRGMPGVDTIPYNVKAVTGNAKTIIITEGEIDCMSLASLGFAAIGIGGANNWKPQYARLLDGFQRVIVWGDPDEAGRTFNREVQRNVKRAVGAYLDTDINDSLVRDGGMDIITAFQKAGGEM